MNDEVKERKINPKHVVIAVVLIISFGAFVWWLPSSLEYEDIDFDVNIIGSIRDVIKEEEEVKIESFNRFECRQYIEEAKFLTIKNQPETNTTKWSVEDQEQVEYLSANMMLKCVKTGEDLTVSDFNYCYDIYYSIRNLLAKMTDMEINSLSESDQVLYQKKYLEYHDNDCGLVEEDLELIYEATLAGVDFDTGILSSNIFK